MDNYICKTCGVQYGTSQTPPHRCLVCEDERQWVGYNGQEWTTLEVMKKAGFRNEIRTLEPGLVGIGIHPSFAIGQRALLVQTPRGNVLWDCISFIDQKTIELVRSLGGLAAISASHPHFYGSMVEWSRALGGVPIYIAEADKVWIMRPDPVIRYWSDTLQVLPGLALVQCGGHFEGSAVLHWAAGANGQGALLVGDTIQVVPDRRYVSYMRSYPNLIPLPASTVRYIVERVRPYTFEIIYGAWWDREVLAEGKLAIERSAERYIRQIEA